jgi:division protein CdvB (Snf7/Vps24/ESCRT-III family)
MEAHLKFRQGRSRIVRFVQQARKAADRYWELARQAYRLGDHEQFRQLAASYLRTREGINRWERYLVRMDTLELRRNEMLATTEFLHSVEAMTQSILRGTDPQEIARMQAELERAVHRTEAVQESLELAMEGTGETLAGTSELSDDVLKSLATNLESGGQAASDAQFDARLEAALKEVERQMRLERS